MTSDTCFVYFWIWIQIYVSYKVILMEKWTLNFKSKYVCTRRISDTDLDFLNLFLIIMEIIISTLKNVPETQVDTIFVYTMKVIFCYLQWESQKRGRCLSLQILKKALFSQVANKGTCFNSLLYSPQIRLLHKISSVFKHELHSCCLKTIRKRSCLLWVERMTNLDISDSYLILWGLPIPSNFYLVKVLHVFRTSCIF